MELSIPFLLRKNQIIIEKSDDILYTICNLSNLITKLAVNKNPFK